MGEQTTVKVETNEATGNLLLYEDNAGAIGTDVVIPREWLPALARHPALVAEIVKGRQRVEVGSMGEIATYVLPELDGHGGTYALIALPEEAP